MVRQLHGGMQAQVLGDREYSTPFPVTNGVKQGCVLAPTLFSMMFSDMLTDAFREANPGMDIRYRTDGRLFNLRRLKVKTKVHVDKLRDSLFADDCALNAGSAEDMQHSMNLFSNACSNFGLTICVKKTEAMYQPASKKPFQEPTVTVNGQKLATVDKFVYLDSTLSRSVHIDDDTHARIAKVSSAFGRLRTFVSVETQRSKPIDQAQCLQSHCPHHTMQAIPGQYTRGTPRTQPISPKLPRRIAHSEVTRQCPKH